MHVGLVTRGDFANALDLANQLHEAGQAVTLYLPYAHTVRELGTSDEPEKRLYEDGLIPRECRVRLTKLPRMRDPRSFGVFRALSQTMRDDGVDVAHLLVGSDEIWYAVLPWLLRDIPIISTLEQPTREVGQRFPFLVVWAIQKLLTSGSDVIIVNGADQAETVHRLYQVRPNRVAYVPLTVRTTAAKWATTATPEEPRTALFFGRADVHKGLEYLVRAQPLITRRVPGARFVIVGHGDEIGRCRQLIEDASRFEVHEGFVPGDEMATYFQRCSLVVLPYLSSTTSGVLMTACAFAKPVVATDISGLCEYVADGDTGLLVPPANIEALAEAIVRLLSDDALRRRMGERAKRWVEGWQESVTQKTLATYQQALSLRANGHQ